MPGRDDPKVTLRWEVKLDDAISRIHEVELQKARQNYADEPTRLDTVRKLLRLGVRQYETDMKGK